MQAHRLSAALQSACFSTYVEVLYKQFSFHHHLLVGFPAEEGCQLLDANCCWERVPIATRHGNFVRSIVVCKEEHKHQQSPYRVNSPLVAMPATLLNWVCYTGKVLKSPVMVSKIGVQGTLQVKICCHLLKELDFLRKFNVIASLINEWLKQRFFCCQHPAAPLMGSIPW